ncbi:MFS transporter [Streptosporangium sp. OZ121]|uniref:MFS transporter n=1 Tax=Streptosporangium sp. OZ121 TaxID=3444183 RepID=UPI003F7A354C
MTVSGLRRRFLALTALQTVPGAVFFPVLVLLVQERGHTLGEIGLLFAVFSAVALALEIPSGSVADVYGRRRILLVSAAVSASACLALALAHDLWPLVAAFVLTAVGRALGSGILDSWYVDSLRELDPEADFEPAVATAQVVQALSLAVGALAGGLVPMVSGHLVMSVWVSLAFALVFTLAAVPLMTTRGGKGTRAPLTSTLSAALKGSLSDATLVRLMILAFGLGWAVTVLEVVWPSHIATLTGDARSTALVYGLVLAVAFTARALGALSAPKGARFQGARGIVLLAAVTASFLAVMGFVVHLAAFAALFLAAQWSTAVIMVLSTLLLHHRATSDQRVTFTSVESFAAQAGGIAGSVLLLAAEPLGHRTIWLVTAAVVLATGAVFVVRKRTGRGQSAVSSALLP